jgi:hypothetical protein
MSALSFNSAIITFLEAEKFEHEHEHDWIQLEKKLWCSSVIAICCDGEEAVRVNFLQLAGNRKIKKGAFNFDGNTHESFKSRDTSSRWRGRFTALTLVGWLSLCHSKPQRTNMIGFIRWMGENIEYSLNAYRAVIIHIKMNAIELFKHLAEQPKPGEKLYLLRFCEMWMREVVMKCGKAANIRNVLNFSAIIDRNGQEALAKLHCRNNHMRFFREADDDKELCCVTDLFNDPNSQPVAAAEAGSEKGSPSSIEGDSDGITQGQEAYHYHPPFPTNQAQQDTEAAIDTYESVENTFLKIESFKKHMKYIGNNIDNNIATSSDKLRVDFQGFHNHVKKKRNAKFKEHMARIKQTEEIVGDMAEVLTGHTDKLEAYMVRTKQAEEALGEQATQITHLHGRLKSLEKGQMPQAAQIIKQLQQRVKRLENDQMNSNPIPEQDRKMAAKAPARDLSRLITPKHSTPTSLTPTTTSKTPTCRKGRFAKPPSSTTNRPRLTLSQKRAPASSENENEHEQKRTPKKPKMSNPIRSTQKVAPASSENENEHEQKRTPKKPKMSTPIRSTQKVAPASSENENEHEQKRTPKKPKMSTPIRQTPTTPTPKICIPIRQTPTTKKGFPASSENEQEQKRRRGKNSAYDSNTDPSEQEQEQKRRRGKNSAYDSDSDPSEQEQKRRRGKNSAYDSDSDPSE